MAEVIDFTSTDPFTLAYRAVWDALFDPLAGFAALVNVANRTDLSAVNPVIRANVECSNLPEVILAQADWTATPLNSKARESTQAYALRIATGSLSVADINKLKWEAWRALERAGPNLGLSFVRVWVIRTATDSVAREGENRGDEKWVTLINVVVTMFIPDTSLTT